MASRAGIAAFKAAVTAGKEVLPREMSFWRALGRAAMRGLESEAYCKRSYCLAVGAKDVQNVSIRWSIGPDVGITGLDMFCCKSAGEMELG